MTYNVSSGTLNLIPRLHDEAGSTSWLYERTTCARRALDELVEPASSCKRGITHSLTSACRKMFFLTKNVLSKVQNLELKMTDFGKIGNFEHPHFPY